MADSRLVKKVYTYCKDYTATQKGSFCYSVKNILGQLNLGHLWVSEQVGEPKEWVSLVMASVRQKDAEAWQLALQKKEKLRVYRTLKFNLKQEEYISWSLPAELCLILLNLEVVLTSCELRRVGGEKSRRKTECAWYA